jgi:hypothetical protein
MWEVEEDAERLATSLLLMPKPLLLVVPVVTAVALAAARDCTADSSALGAGAAPPPCELSGTAGSDIGAGSGRRK